MYLRKLPTYEQCRHLGRGKGNREAQPQLIVKQSMPEDDDEEEENCSREKRKNHRQISAGQLTVCLCERNKIK